MQQLIVIIHILASISIVALILMQRGKGSDAGAAFGNGAAQTMFGSRGSFPFLCKLIGGLAMIFFVTSLLLGYFNSRISAPNNSTQLPIGTEDTGL